ncbi:hypothetical protein ES705_34180 [subsurface metagenome]
MEIATTGPSGRCSLRCVLSVARTPRYLSNPVVIGQCTVAIAIAKTGRADNISARFKDIRRPGMADLCVPLECDGVLWR